MMTTMIFALCITTLAEEIYMPAFATVGDEKVTISQGESRKVTSDGKQYELAALALQRASDAAKPGDVVVIPPGTYRMSSPGTFEGTGAPNQRSLVKFKAGVIYRGTNATFLGDPASHRYRISESNITLDGIKFENAKLVVGGNPNGSFVTGINLSNLTFVDGIQEDSKGKNYPSEHQVELLRVQDSTVDALTMSRSTEAPGRGINFWKSQNITFKNSSIIGAYKTGINMGSVDYDAATGAYANTGRNYQITVESNTVKRTSITPGIEDHGIYIWGANEITLSKNHVGGWSMSGTGGAIKLRNAENITISDNTFVGSGVHLYTYSPKDNGPVLQNVNVLRNTIELGATTSDDIGRIPNRDIVTRNYGGIFYSFEAVNTPSAQWEACKESGINIVGNTVKGGTIIIFDGVNGKAFDLSDNNCVQMIVEVVGTKEARNKYSLRRTRR